MACSCETLEAKLLSIESMLDNRLSQLEARVTALESQSVDLSPYLEKANLLAEIQGIRDSVVLSLRDSENWYPVEIDLSGYLMDTEE